MLTEESSYASKVQAWFHTAIVSSGPWLISILAINMVLTYSDRWGLPNIEKELLIGAIIYSTIISQVLTAPFQMIVTRYIADRMYAEEYAYIKPSFWGVSLLVSILALALAAGFYHRATLPFEFIYLVSALMVVLTILWILMVYQSTLRNFAFITIANLLGVAVTYLLILYLAGNPFGFQEYSGVSNLLLAYLGGVTFFTIMLLIAFLAEMQEDNGKIFHYIRYFHTVPSLWPIGLLYTTTIWVDNVIMWFSPISIQIFGLYRYAPSYDLATFFAYLTILPSIMLFIVLIETDFYVKCREFYLVILRNGPLEDVRKFADRMWASLKESIVKTFEIQLFVTIACIAVARHIFPLLNVPGETERIFSIYAMGAFCNAFILICLQVLLYIGERNRTLLLMALYFVLNTAFTLFSLTLGEAYYGIGFFIASFITMLVGFWLTYLSYRRVVSHTYITQPVYIRTKDKFFEKLERRLNRRQEEKDALDLVLLEKHTHKRRASTQEVLVAEGAAEVKPGITFFDVKTQRKFTSSTYTIRIINNRFFAVTQSPSGTHECWILITNAQAAELRNLR